MRETIGSPLGPAGALLLAALAAGVRGAAQEHPREPHRHPEAQTVQNTVPGGVESVAAGAKAYAKLCANCHGTGGLGNGRLAAAMAAYGARPSDLTDAEWQHGSADGEIFAIIRDGVGPDLHMPGFAGKVSDIELWHLVNFVKSLSGMK